MWFILFKFIVLFTHVIVIASYYKNSGNNSFWLTLFEQFEKQLTRSWTKAQSPCHIPLLLSLWFYDNWTYRTRHHLNRLDFNSKSFQALLMQLLNVHILSTGIDKPTLKLYSSVINLVIKVSQLDMLPKYVFYSKKTHSLIGDWRSTCDCDN